jgi:hypothetical protein
MVTRFPMQKFLGFAAAALVAATATAGFAQATATAAAPMTPPTATSDLLEVSCAEFTRVLAIANPGQNPSQERQGAATRAQHDIYMVMIWVNGYATAKSKDPAQTVLSQQWITKNVAALNKACKTDPKMSVFDAAAKL